MNIWFIKTPEDTKEKWHLVRDFFDRVAKEAAHGEFTVDDMERMSHDGMLTTMVFDDDDGKPVMAFAYQYVRYKTGLLSVNIMACGGKKLGECADAYWEAILAFLKQGGAQMVEARCNKAMARILARIGFKPTYEVVRVAL